MTNERKSVHWNVVVSQRFDQEVEAAVSRGLRASKSELIRDGARRILERERKRARTAQTLEEEGTNP
jgi:Arc/MetJ-type ribon-helix-helix transcriptional regulator